jgi:hypothetical protein
LKESNTNSQDQLKPCRLLVMIDLKSSSHFMYQWMKIWFCLQICCPNHTYLPCPVQPVILSNHCTRNYFCGFLLPVLTWKPFRKIVHMDFFLSCWCLFIVMHCLNALMIQSVLALLVFLLKNCFLPHLYVMYSDMVIDPSVIQTVNLQYYLQEYVFVA